MTNLLTRVRRAVLAVSLGASAISPGVGRGEGGSGHIGLRLQHAKETYEIGRHLIFETATRATINEQYRIYGAKAIAHNTANILRIRMRESNGSKYAVEARAFDNGFAWRILVANSGSTVKVSEETSTWILPQGEAWFGERNNDWKLKSYAGELRKPERSTAGRIGSGKPSVLIDELTLMRKE